MPNILHLIGIKGSSPEKVYPALTTLKGLSGWWTETLGEASKVGGLLKFKFGDGGFDMKVLELKPNVGATWEVVGGSEEWIGTQIVWQLKATDAGTKVFFTHQNWREPTEFMHHCSTKWAAFLLSLKAYVESGTGQPFPNDIQIVD